MMENTEPVIYRTNSINLEIQISLDENIYWLTIDQISKLLGKNRTVISKTIKKIYDEHVREEGATCAKYAQVQLEGSREVKRVVKYYNREVIDIVGHQLNPKAIAEFDEWFNSIAIDLKHHSLTNKSNIIRFDNGIVALDVNISPEENTVWLSQNQIAILFETTQPNVSMHIKNIYKEGELFDNSVHKKSLYTEAPVVEENANTDTPVSKKSLHTETTIQKEVLCTSSDGKQYLVTYYNLRMILAVGYRVKSNRAIEFRNWASSVLQNYIMKGYAIDENRIKVSQENYFRLLEDVGSIKTDVKRIKETLYGPQPNEKFIYNGQYYDGYTFINKLICSAKKRVIIVDRYAGPEILNLFIKSKREIEKIIYCGKPDKISKEIIDKFTQQYGEITFIEVRHIHDRFLLIDNDSYIVGTSFNSIGNKTSCVVKTQSITLEDILRREE